MLKAGTVLGNYEIIAPIGAGGMGVVYRALHRGLRKEVALNVLLPNLVFSYRASRQNRLV